MINLSKCIYCQADNNLNTDLTLTIDDKKVAVKVCDIHAEEATIKSAKEAYIQAKAKIDEVIALAKSMGLEISVPQGNGMSVAKSIPKPQSQEIRGGGAIEDMTIDKSFVDTSKVDRKDFSNLAKLIPDGSVGAEAYGCIDPTNIDVSKEDRASLKQALQGKVKMDLAEGRIGMPIPIPTVRKDGLGTTTVTVKQTMDDNKLQKKFKNMAEISQDPYGWGQISDFRHGYDEEEQLRKCALCNGIGSLVQSTAAGRMQTRCPKCNGSGFMTV